MNSFELNKIMGAILGTCLILLSLNIGASAIFSPHKPAKPGFDIAVKEAEGGAATAAKEPEQPIEALLASASGERGTATSKQCAACHTFEKGGPNRVGPNLWNVVNRPKASEAGFNYSAAMKAKGGTWTFDDLSKFLASPKGFVPGTNMTYAGLPRGQQRADMIAFLAQHADSPVAMPTAAQAPAAPAPQGGPPK